MSADSDRRILHVAGMILREGGRPDVADELRKILERQQHFQELRSENFSDRPLTTTHHKGLRSGFCTDWKSRDLLIDILRRLDSGELDLHGIVVTALAPSETSSEGTATHVWVATDGMLTTLALLTRALHMKAAE